MASKLEQLKLDTINSVLVAVGELLSLSFDDSVDLRKVLEGIDTAQLAIQPSFASESDYVLRVLRSVVCVAIGKADAKVAK